MQNENVYKINLSIQSKTLKPYLCLNQVLNNTFEMKQLSVKLFYELNGTSPVSNRNLNELLR